MKRKTRYKSHGSKSKPVPVPEPLVPEPEPVPEPVPEPAPREPEFKGALQPMKLKPPVRWYTYEGLY